MKRIDILGPPGSGKTTISRAIINSPGGHNIFSPRHVKANILAEKFRSDVVSLPDVLRDIVFRLFKGYPAPRIDQASLASFLRDNLARYDELIEKAIDSVSKDRDTSPIMRAKRIGWLVSSFEDIALLEAFCSEKIVICDESLFTRVLLLAFPTSSTIEQIKPYSSLFVPDFFIYLRISRDELLNRLRQRARVTFDHSGIHEAEMEAAVGRSIDALELSFQRAQALGVKGIEIDAERDLDKNLDEIKRHLLQLNGSK